MKLGFICLGLPDHLNPMTALARQLQARNHEVVFLYSSGAGGLPFVCGPEKDHINEKLPEISKKQGLDALPQLVGQQAVGQGSHGPGSSHHPANPRFRNVL